MYEEIVREDIASIAEKLGEEAKNFEGKTVLISGGGGFLGKYIVGALCHLNDTIFSRPCRVISVDNYITGQHHPHFNYRGRPEVLEVWADVAHPLPVREDINYIIHAAGLASPVYYKKYPLETIESAVSGAKNLLELGRRNKNLEGFLFFSSSEIYGDPDPTAVPTPETYHGFVSSVGPRACYDESKRLGETLAVIYHEQFGLPTKIVRPFNVFGPGMSHNDRRVLPMFAYMVLNKKPIPVHGDGLQTRTFCYITDAIDGFFRVLIKGKPGHAYNIGNDTNEISMKDLAELVGSLKGNGASYELIPYPNSYPAGEPMRRCPDISKAKEHLGFTAQTSLKKGISRFMSWCGNDPQYKDGGVF
ncbi:MAG: nucleoside-diphosphate sugar epimerase [Parcubacteria group bacterium RIFCSPLOWO2_01_FULL_40_65]|nr:MAG: nucleoside-diphosphate sugar epimerase [Parcubacteria group bacterium RIFCSPHIGHO2_01_FULL_40_30]OHB19521.1 MAG: nucleoside-diphosphate sugar epimerase [Parcubacteria group bacterium RIFCSPHIGHO2_02_FULL_40_12]OHB21462.1 MAG: nucleoside-diphosphate sugar epimerase [Parcubacteria group bacterium RIFCSPLOWO2_01_FULL_40_65]OHB22974.1 MAG: nucleoside-diphosphate sugar epimerase [Parcubacteria group bacterium RIFCSPLOWO2_02_FULL_40_12]OHB24415.1 MAG: nucleoside-diphosphate sugar epimerase [P